MCRFSSELQREFSSGYSHGDILPSDPRVGLLGVYFLWGASGLANQVESDLKNAGEDLKYVGKDLKKAGQRIKKATKKGK